ncbi:MAG: hypothetical protein ACLVB5_02660 [Christensenellales bacterium]
MQSSRAKSSVTAPQAVRHSESGAVSPSDSESGQTQPAPIKNVVSA